MIPLHHLCEWLLVYVIWLYNTSTFNHTLGSCEKSTVCHFLWNLVLARGSLEPPTCRVELRLRRARYPLLHGGEWTQGPLKSIVVCILVDVESAACAFLRSLKNLLLRRGFCQKFTRPELTAGMATTSMPEWPELAMILTPPAEEWRERASVLVQLSSHLAMGP